MIGSNLASVAGSALGLELEGLSPEDREFEAAKQFVRFAGQTVSNARQADPRAEPEAMGDPGDWRLGSHPFATRPTFAKLHERRFDEGFTHRMAAGVGGLDAIRRRGLTPHSH